jgi:hypothetical protein
MCIKANNFNFFRINTYEKTGGGYPLLLTRISDEWTTLESMARIGMPYGQAEAEL